MLVGKTKKVWTAGRFGSRYGVGIRKRLLKIESNQKQKHSCPSCGFLTLKRASSGIFKCKKCSSTFAGGTFLPSTMTGSIVRKIISQKAFGLAAQQLLEQAGEQLEQAKEQETIGEQAEESQRHSAEKKHSKHKNKESDE